MVLHRIVYAEAVKWDPLLLHCTYFLTSAFNFSTDGCFPAINYLPWFSWNYLMCFKSSWFICGNISHHRSEFRWHKISLGVCVNNMPLPIFNWLSIVTIMLIILHAFFFTSHTKSKKKKKSVHKTCKEMSVHVACGVHTASLSTISTAIWLCVCTYIFLYQHIHCHFAVTNSFREISVASPNKHLACITPNKESLVLSLSMQSILYN